MDGVFSVSPFILDAMQNEEGWRLYTPVGAARITDANLARALDGLASMRPRASQSNIAKLLESKGLPVDAAQRFLLRLNVLRRIDVDKRTLIYCPSDHLCRPLSELVVNHNAVQCEYTTDISNIDSASLLIVIQNSYSSKKAREIYAACEANRACIILHSYFVFRHFVIDGFSCRAMGLPDHFSSLHNLAGLDRNPAFKPVSWADFFLTDPYALENLSVPTFEASGIETAAALHLLYTRFRPFLNPGAAPLFPDDLSTIIELNLDTGRVERHRGCHSNFSPSPRTL